MARINIPKNPGDKIKLAKAIKTKHTAAGAASPLNGLDMADFGNKTDTADTENQNADKFYKAAEKATQDRDLALGGDNPPKGTVDWYLRAARDVLGGLNKGNEKKLGDWGFEVDDSPTGGNKPAAPKP